MFKNIIISIILEKVFWSLANPPGDKLYQIWARGQLCLGWALIPVKPAALGLYPTHEE
jgi:hypothetical protein